MKDAYQTGMILYSPLSCPSPSSCRRTLGVGLGCNWCGRAGYGENSGAKRSKVGVGGGSLLCAPQGCSAMEGGGSDPKHLALSCRSGGLLLPVLQTEKALCGQKEQLQKCQTFPQLKELRAAHLPHLEMEN